MKLTMAVLESYIRKNMDLFFKEKHNLIFEPEDSYFGSTVSISFVNDDFRILVDIDEELKCDITLSRPFFTFSIFRSLTSTKDLISLIEDFCIRLQKVKEQENILPVITENECELFLQTSSLDGLASGVIEYKKSLYAIAPAPSLDFKDKTVEDRSNNVKRKYYVYAISKQDLEMITMSSLDWMRNMDLTPLCQNWSSLSLTTGGKNAHYISKYKDYKFEPKSPPIMVLKTHNYISKN